MFNPDKGMKFNSSILTFEVKQKNCFDTCHINLIFDLKYSSMSRYVSSIKITFINVFTDQSPKRYSYRRQKLNLTNLLTKWFDRWFCA